MFSPLLIVAGLLLDSTKTIILYYHDEELKHNFLSESYNMASLDGFLACLSRIFELLEGQIENRKDQKGYNQTGDRAIVSCNVTQAIFNVFLQQ